MTYPEGLLEHLAAETPVDRDAVAEYLDISRRLLTIPYTPEQPTPKQAAFLLDLGREALFGGAAGPGKSSGLLMAALQFVSVPHYASIIFRRSYADLSMPGALMDRAAEWLGGQEGVRWDQIDHSWTFPGGARLTFGYLDKERDRFKYQGAEFHFAGFDELTQFKERDYRYLFSRVRRPSSGPMSRMPIRVRAATNPGGVGHEWVYQRFVRPWEMWRRQHQEWLASDRTTRPPRAPRRSFHPATLTDNPHLDTDEYSETLQELDPITREQLLRGDWAIRNEGRVFRRHWFNMKSPDEVPADISWVRYWDLAATEPDAERDPDYTAGALLGRDPRGQFWLADMVHLQSSPSDVERAVVATTQADAIRRGHVTTFIEQEPGASGKSIVAYYQRVLAGFSIYGDLPSGKKIVRAGPVASQAEAGNINVVAGPWNDAMLEEFEVFPDGVHDDQVDAVSGALAMLVRGTVPIVGASGNTQVNPWAIGVAS